MSSLSYGYVEINEPSESKTFTIKNRGQKHLKITSVSISPYTLKDTVTISPTASSLAGRILAPDESVVVTASVEPKDFGIARLELQVSARGLSEADAISAGIGTEFISPSWSKSANLPLLANVSSGDASFYETNGSTFDSSYEFGRISTIGLYQRYVRVKKIGGDGPVIIKSWGTSYVSSDLSVTATPVSLPVRLSNVGDYKDFVLKLEPTGASVIHTCIASFEYYELGKNKTYTYTMYASSDPQQLKFYAAGKNPGETYQFEDKIGVNGGTTGRQGVICIVENTGDIPLSILDTWITTSSSGGSSRSKSLSLGSTQGNWSITADIEGNSVPPGRERGFIVWVENPNTTNSAAATDPTVEMYAFVETDSDTNPIQKIKIIAQIVR